MKKKNKLQLVSDYKKILNSSPNILILQAHLLSVEELIVFKQIHKSIKIQIIKNKLFIFALNETRYRDISNYISGSIFIIYYKQNPLYYPIINFLNENKTKYILLFGIINDSIVQKNELIKLFSMNQTQLYCSLVNDNIIFTQQHFLMLLKQNVYKFLFYLQQE